MQWKLQLPLRAWRRCHPRNSEEVPMGALVYFKVQVMKYNGRDNSPPQTLPGRAKKEESGDFGQDVDTMECQQCRGSLL